MLDALVLAAHGVRPEDAVSGYQETAAQSGGGWYYPWSYGPDPNNPQWYQGVAAGGGYPGYGPGYGYGSSPG